MSRTASPPPREVPEHRVRVYEAHLGRELCSGERAALTEGYRAGGLGQLPCPYLGELAPIWSAGRYLRKCALLRQEPDWVRHSAAPTPAS